MLLLDLKPTLFNIEPIECSNRKEIICVVDRSGSMSGTAMRNAKEALKMFIRSLPCEDQGSTNQSRLVLGPAGTVRSVGPNGAGIPDLQFQALSSLDIHVRSCEHHGGVFLEAFFLGQVLDHQTYNDLSIGSARGVKSQNVPHVICRI